MKMKKLLSIALYLCMFVSLLSVSAFAEDVTEPDLASVPAPVSEPAPAHTHQWTLVSKQEATCGSPGKEVYKCDCGAGRQVNLDQLTEHQWVLNPDDYKEPTCGSPGYEAYICKICSGGKQVEIAQLTVHNWSTEPTSTKAATCESPGYNVYTCLDCGGGKQEEIKQLDHIWNDTPTVKEATCKSPGYRAFSCTRTGCTAGKQEEIPQLSHQWKKIDESSVAATCTTDGFDILTCDKCGVGGKKTVSALTHDYKGAVTTEPTLTSEGVMTYTCTRTGCGDSYTESIAKLKNFTASLSAASGTYNGAAHDPVVVKDGSTVLTADTHYTLSWSASPVNAGSYTVTVTGTGDYASAEIAILSYTINKAPIIVVAKDASKESGAKDPVFSYTVSGIITGETLKGALSRAAGETPGTYQITLGTLGTSNPNYSISYTPAKLTINPSAAELVTQQIKDLFWLPDLIVDPGNQHQRTQVLNAWVAYNKLSAAEKQQVPADLVEWLSYQVASSDYAIISGSGAYWYKGRSSGLSFHAIDPHSKFAGVRVDGVLIDSSNYTYYRYGDNDYGYEDVAVITLKPSYLTELSLGKHSISICYWNGYAPGYFRVVESAGSPPTGDSANFPLWGGMLFLSGLGMTAAAAYVLKNRKKEN